MLCGGVFFAFFGPQQVPAYLAIFYGLGLLATAHFAPRSIMWLGWSFLLAGLAAFVLSFTDQVAAGFPPDMIMLATFGGFHLVYAGCTWPRAVQAATVSGPP
jgi:hypothetical protein